MRKFDLEGLFELRHLPDYSARRGAFRQAFANLARELQQPGVAPLEGLSPSALEDSVKIAREQGFFENLEWLSADAVAVALFELASAIPSGQEKRELGRRVLLLLHEGAAPTFVSLATRMAQISRRAFDDPAVSTRLPLVFSTSPAELDVGGLATAMLTRRELAREWIGTMSSGALFQRQLAARIVERAAFAMAKLNASQSFVRAFSNETIESSIDRLFFDREPFVWRHAACVRGFQAVVQNEWFEKLQGMLQPHQTIKEWRRAATAIGAVMALDPDRAAVLSSLALKLRDVDPGIGPAIVRGLTWAVDFEPHHAESLLRKWIVYRSDTLVESFGVLLEHSRAEWLSDIGEKLRENILAQSSSTIRQSPGGRLFTPSLQPSRDTRLQLALLTEDLHPIDGEDATVRHTITLAKRAYVSLGARVAHQLAAQAFSLAEKKLEALKDLSVHSDLELRSFMEALHDFDVGIFTEGAAESLMHLNCTHNHQGNGLDSFAAFKNNYGEWLLRQPRVSNPSFTNRWLVSMLHWVDAESVAESAPSSSTTIASAASQQSAFRRTQTAERMLDEIRTDRDCPRAIYATLGRSLDAQVRSTICEPIDVMLVMAMQLAEAAQFYTLSEACMLSDVQCVLNAFGRLDETSREKDPKSGDISVASIFVDPLQAFLNDLGTEGRRLENFKVLVGKLLSGLDWLNTVRSKEQVAQSEELEALSMTVLAIHKMIIGARQRVLARPEYANPNSTPGTSEINSVHAGMLAALEGSATALSTELSNRLPAPFASRLLDAIVRCAALPATFDESSETAIPLVVIAERLPNWLGPKRMLGAFFILRPLGSGATSSVFVAKRYEEKNVSNAELFALKVPDYNGAVARNLSETEFLDFFRQEASALLGLPPSPHLAKFVTFDLAARPKPILVMELIAGPTLESFLARSLRAATRGREILKVGVFVDLLISVLDGLATMHQYAIGHLDLKPGNVILRDSSTPTLVDFGLSGRHIRPGCATGPYGAPEIWGALPEDFKGLPSPLPADVYAFGALCFEVLTGEVLFESASEAAAITQHLTHKGHPKRLDRLSAIRPLVELLEHTLEPDPRKRWTVPQVRRALEAMAPYIAEFAWPLGLPA